MSQANIILLGPAGSGKSSQVAQIHLHKKCDPVALGAIIRAARFLNSPMGKRLKPELDAGKLIDDETANTIVFAHILEMPKERGFILDGYPRNQAQAKALKHFLDLNKISITHNDLFILCRDTYCLLFNLFVVPFKNCFTGAGKYAFGFTTICSGILFIDRFQSELLVWQFFRSLF